jgi:hypothetical protein
MQKAAKKRLLIVGGVVGLGALAYYLYSRSQAAPTALPAATPSPTPLPQQTGPKKPSSQLQAAINAYQTAAAGLQANDIAVAANPMWAGLPSDQRDALVAQLATMKQQILARAAAEGVSVSV